MGESNRITAAQVEAVVESIDKKLAENPADKVLKKKIKGFKKDILPRKQKYEESFSVFKGRNSYSKTDPDATFMRMKEDAMLNGQLKPGESLSGRQPALCTGNRQLCVPQRKATDTCGKP